MDVKSQSGVTRAQKKAASKIRKDLRGRLVKPGNSESQGGRGLKLFPGAMSFPFRTHRRSKLTFGRCGSTSRPDGSLVLGFGVRFASASTVRRELMLPFGVGQYGFFRFCEASFPIGRNCRNASFAGSRHGDFQRFFRAPGRARRWGRTPVVRSHARKVRWCNVRVVHERSDLHGEKPETDSKPEIRTGRTSNALLISVLRI